MTSTGTERTPRRETPGTPTDPAAAQPAKSEGAAFRLLLFGVGARVYGCDIADIREIVPNRPATRLPGAPDHVRGLINLRGTIVTVVDLARRIDGGEARPDGSIILVDRGSRQVGLLVDDVRDVQPVASDRFETATDDLSRGGLVRGLGHLDDGVVIVLDVLWLVGQIVG
ncbi:MAG TPA: chemotaxis protein CheW [Gemmatimonadaceae bacterium]|nr:chemotaxis protein CheW [Gemmatimonadaceae bacterium]